MATIVIRIPTPLRSFTDGNRSVTVDAETAGQALEALVVQHPPLHEHLFDDSGSLRSFVNVFKNDEDIRFLDRENTSVASADELSIVPSIAGGSETVLN